MCICVSLYVNLYMCMYVYLCVYLNVSIYVCAWVCVYACVYMCAYESACMFACMFVCLCVCVYVYVCLLVSMGHACGGQRWLVGPGPLLPLWIPGIELGLSSLATGIFNSWTSSLRHATKSFIVINTLTRSHWFCCMGRPGFSICIHLPTTVCRITSLFHHDTLKLSCAFVFPIQSEIQTDLYLLILLFASGSIRKPCCCCVCFLLSCSWLQPKTGCIHLDPTRGSDWVYCCVWWGRSCTVAS